MMTVKVSAFDHQPLVQARDGEREGGGKNLDLSQRNCLSLLLLSRVVGYRLHVP